MQESGVGEGVRDGTGVRDGVVDMGGVMVGVSVLVGVGVLVGVIHSHSSASWYRYLVWGDHKILQSSLSGK
ncbi:hypothetical protein A3J20_04745 [Candidatus Gottesmanbacteria bacterium RIFCSPLOWO2_02_FULL_42_29]|nr:MAG: hypothetical protein A3E72_00045 [Candidatus Gottesmanbacteria bacterium RIFCSPHIGHO2_12_FULL_43_26]OGG34065.1 MAG: hypothetical protein A3G68_04330 [Candidatus Gottesmanbacteria bacterium RIFCSPLOWO2_12_FULL_42_10]OGG38673.1 MAG: hypothetical protein A3J20_04745 [Candidatus Gottesmanbacteria bacterium RIFCSPLOWO2_02_FULL_42_29]